MSSINSIGGSGISMMPGMKRPDPSKMVDNLFSRLDTTGKGYLEKSDLQSVISQLSGSGNSGSTDNTGSTASVDDIFSKLDGNGDGKITKDEMSSGMKKLADALDSQLNQMRTSGASPRGKGGPPPSGGMPPPSGAGSASSSQASSAAKITEKADTNGDGKVSIQEEIAYLLASQSSASTSSTSGATGNTASPASTNSDAKVLKTIMDLMFAYSDNGSSNTGLSVTA